MLLLDHDKLIAMHLSGTVRLPSPTPATASVAIVASDPERGQDDTFLEVTHRVNPRLSIARLVRLADVRVIHAPWCGNGNGRSDAAGHDRPSASYKTADAIRALVSQKLGTPAKGNGRTSVPWLNDAAVYLAESAPVLMQVEVGLTAAESADYYPPMSKAACDSFACDSFTKEGRGGHGADRYYGDSVAR